VLAAKCGIRVLSPAYRLAPEHPFPAAVEDALECYRYLLSKGYAPGHIALCGESAGGGLCYSLCLKLKQLDLPQPGCIIAISPWTDMGCRGESYRTNAGLDPSLSLEQLQHYAKYYGADPDDPVASPLWGDLTGLAPSAIFAAEEEILFDDGADMHRRLQQAGCISRLYVKKDRWHAYLLYGLEEDRDDMQRLNRILDDYISPENKLRWMSLDNSAKIYPAARNQNWSNVFRLSATLTEEIDVSVMQAALDVTVRRFPSMAARLRRGFFWYYLEQLSEAPQIRSESSYPLVKMSREEIRQCALRVIVYRDRVAVEMFHSLTDGNGALVFLKTLLAEYLQQKHDIRIPAEQGVLGRLEEPSEEELEDSFLKHAGQVKASRRASDAWRITGTPEADGFLHVTCLRMPVDAVLAGAKERGVTATTFLCAAMMQAIQNLQRERVPNPARHRPVKVLIPVNLRPMFGSRTLRNFVLYTTPEIDPRLGEYSFDEICRIVHHHLGAEVTRKKMRMLMTTNVSSERSKFIKAVPLFLKNPIMKAVFSAVGERKSCLSLSNLGAVKLPEQMRPYIAGLDFILGVQNTAPYNCGVISWGNDMHVNFIRNIREPALEYHFYRCLREQGIPVSVQSNGN